MGHPMVTVKQNYVSEKKTSYIIGSFNMNCLKYHENCKTKHIYDNFLKSSYLNLRTFGKSY